VPVRQQRDGAGDHLRRLGGADAGLVSALELARERAPALRPRDGVGVVGERARVAAGGALLAASVDLCLGRVEIERDRLARVASELAVQALADARLGALDATDVLWLEAACQLTRRRRRRRARHRAQARARAVGADVLDVVKAVRAGDLALRQRHDKPTRRQPPPTRLDRHPGERPKLGVDQLDQPRAARQLTDDRQSRIRRKRRIVGADRQPSGASAIVTGLHPQGDAASPSKFCFTPVT
jgi:hypothetical protein